jgi:hypothetical protein
MNIKLPNCDYYNRYLYSNVFILDRQAICSSSFSFERYSHFENHFQSDSEVFIC